MKKLVLTFFLAVSSAFCVAQISTREVPHLYEHTFPEITSQDERVVEMLEQITENQIITDVEHLSSYLNRRADAVYIYQVKDWLISQYENMNLDSVYLHDFQVIPFWDTVPKPFTSAPNVLAMKRGKVYPNEFVICGAHYDSFVRTEGEFDPDTLVSPGADDNASGTAGILTTARILSNYNFKRSIIFALWNAEEFGLCGSSEYAKACRNDSLDIVAYFNLDMTGYLNPGDDIHINLLYNNCDSLLGKFIKQVSHVYLPDIEISHKWLPSGDTDYSSFNRNGYQAISPSEDVHNMSPYIHTNNDIIGLSVNNWEQSVVFTKLNLASVALAAGLYSESVNEIEYPEEEIKSYEVYDLMGRRVNDNKSGVYIIRYHTKDGKCFVKKYFLKY